MTNKLLNSPSPSRLGLPPLLANPMYSSRAIHRRATILRQTPSHRHQAPTFHPSHNTIPRTTRLITASPTMLTLSKATRRHSRVIRHPACTLLPPIHPTRKEHGGGMRM